MSDTLRQPASPAATFRRWALLAVMSTLVIRSLFAFMFFDNLSEDDDNYAAIAECIQTESVFGLTRNVAVDGEPEEVRVRPIAFRPPLYPMMLSIFVQEGKLNRVGVAALHVICGTLTVYLTFLFAWRMGMVRLSFVAAMGVAVDPLLLQYSTLVMTETIATLCAIVSLVSINRFFNQRNVNSAIVAGVFLGISIACRPTFLIWTALIGLLMLRQVIRGRIPVALAATMFAVVLLLMMPWTFRNLSQTGKPVIATTHGGYTLFLANNESLYQHQSGEMFPEIWKPDEQFDARIEKAIADAIAAQENNETTHWELEYDRICSENARTDIANNPMAFAKSSVLRVVQLWRPLPNQTEPEESPNYRKIRYAVGLWYSVLFMLVLAALWRIRDKAFAHPWCWSIALLIAITLLHTFYFSNIRMRAPAMPVVYVLATYGVGRFLAARKRGRTRRRRRDQ